MEGGVLWIACSVGGRVGFLLTHLVALTLRTLSTANNPNQALHSMVHVVHQRALSAVKVCTKAMAVFAFCECEGSSLLTMPICSCMYCCARG